MAAKINSPMMAKITVLMLLCSFSSDLVVT